MDYNTAAIRQLLNTGFGDEELYTFCDDYFPAVAEKFTAGQTKGARVQLLIDYARRNGRMEELLSRVREASPYQYAQFEAQLSSAPSAPQISSPTGVKNTSAQEQGPVRILFLGANPLNTDRLRLDEEVRTIDERLRSAHFRDRFDLVQGGAVRHSDLAGYLLRYQPHIVHFSGHGSDVGQLILEDRDANPSPVSPQAVASLFRTLKDNVRCVVLNACFSATQADAIAAEIECVVGTSQAIEDTAAILFASGFYQALGYGRSVYTAFELGKAEIGLGGRDDGKILHLLTKPGVDPTTLTFT